MATISGTSGADTLYGDTDGPDTDDTFVLQTGPANNGDNNGLDQYFGGGGHNRILGGWSLDVLHVTNNLANLHDIQEIDGGDTTPGRNTILATTGNDTLDFSGYILRNFVIDGGMGNDVITGALDYANQIRGGGGNDTLTGGNLDDTFNLVTGGDTNGLDQYHGGTGHDRIVGGWSYDTLNVTNHLANLDGIEELDGGDDTVGRNVILAKAGVHDTLDFTGFTIRNFDIDGRDGNDVITGSDDDNRIIGNTGNDTLDGAGGSDTYLVGTGHGADTFSDTGIGGTDRIVATATGVQIGISAISGIEQISSGGKSGVTVVGTANHQTLDFSGVAFDGIGVVDALGGNDVIFTSNLTAGQAYRGGAGSDIFHLGAAASILRVSAADNGGFDSFLGNTAGATHRIVAETAGTQIGIGADYGYYRVGSNLFSDLTRTVDIIDGNGKANVTIVGSDSTHDAWDLSQTQLIGIAEVGTGYGNDQIRVSDLAPDGQAYRGGQGNDVFTLGSQDTRLLVSSNDNGWFDSFAGNAAGATNTIVVENDNTQVGIAGSYGDTNSVDVIDATGRANASIVGSSSTHDVWDLSGTELRNITGVATGGGNDKVQSALMDAGDPAITYDGGAGSLDKLTISLTAAQAGNATLLAQIAQLTPGSGNNGTLNAAGVHLTAQNWESFAVAVDTGAGFDTLNILFGTANHDAGPPYTPVLSVPAAKINESWAIFGLGGDDIITGGNKADFIDGGLGNDTISAGGGDDTIVMASTNGGNFDNVDGGSGYDTVVSGDGADIQLRTIAGIEEISSGGFAGVDLVGNGPNGHENWDLSGIKLRGIGEVSNGVGDDTVHTSNDSDAVGGQAYRGGLGNDTFYFGSQSTRLLASSADTTGFDAYHGNTAGATHTIIAEDNGTRIGIAGSYGGTNSVDVIDATGRSGVSIVGADSAHDAWDFSGTDFRNIATVATGGGDDVVKTALMQAGDAAITYDGGAYTHDHLTISLTSAQAADAGVMADLANLTAGSGANGTVDHGGLDLTATGWEIIDWVVVG